MARMAQDSQPVARVRFHGASSTFAVEPSPGASEAGSGMVICKCIVVSLVCVAPTTCRPGTTRRPLLRVSVSTPVLRPTLLKPLCMF